MLHYFDSPYRAQADEFLYIAGDSAVKHAHKLELMHERGRKLGSLLLEPWQDNQFEAHHAIHGAAVLACEPALAAYGIRQLRREDAIQVNDNLSYMNSYLQKCGMFDLTENSDIRGVLSEQAILSVFWWGIAHGVIQESSYLFPTTSSKDAGSRGGLRNGYDLFGKLDSKQIKLQVKQSKKKIHNIYEPSITVISPRQLDPNRGTNAVNILQSHRTDNANRLEIFSNTLASLIRPKKVKAVQYDETIYSRRNKRNR